MKTQLCWAEPSKCRSITLSLDFVISLIFFGNFETLNPRTTLGHLFFFPLLCFAVTILACRTVTQQVKRFKIRDQVTQCLHSQRSGGGLHDSVLKDQVSMQKSRYLYIQNLILACKNRCRFLAGET